MSVELPHFSAYFTIGKNGAEYVEQNSEADIQACVFRLVSCIEGYREDSPEYGVEELVWNTIPLPLAQFEAQIKRQEPRATTSIVEKAINNVQSQRRVYVEAG